MSPLEHRHVLRQIPLAHAPEPAQEDPQPRPQPLLRIAVNLTHPVTIQVQRPGALGPRVVHRHMDSALVPAHSAISRPLVRVDRRPRQAGVRDDLLQLRTAGRADDIQSDLTRLPPDDPGDRRPIVGEGPVAAAVVGPPPGRVGRIGVREAFFPPR